MGSLVDVVKSPFKRTLFFIWAPYGTFKRTLKIFLALGCIAVFRLVILKH